MAQKQIRNNKEETRRKVSERPGRFIVYAETKLKEKFEDSRCQKEVRFSYEIIRDEKLGNCQLEGAEKVGLTTEKVFE